MTQTDFHHEAFLYGDADEFLAGTVPFLRAGLELGEPALVAVSPKRRDALRAELGTDAERVGFVEMEVVGRNPARIVPAWRQFVDEHGGHGRPVRGIGEPVWPGRSEAEMEECQRHEALLNHAFWEGPRWRLLCPYDGAALPDHVLDAALLSHAFASGSASGRGVGACDLDPHACRPFAGRLAPRPAEAISFAFDRRTLHEARALAGEQARRAGLSDDRAFDLVAAVGELIANSVLHGGGSGSLGIWREAGALLVEVTDAGRIESPLAGRVRPEPRQESGRGLWMANHLCDLVQIRSGPAGTTVRLRMELNHDA